MKVLISGCGGLIGSEAASFYLKQNAQVVGIDNNQRKYFFGISGDTSGNITTLLKNKNFEHIKLDIRDRAGIDLLYREKGPFDLIIHTAAQPSHDWAKNEPYTDFDINAVGTFNMLESFRLNSPDGVFIFTSTNKVYGDRPNLARLIEKNNRYDLAAKQAEKGISKNGINEDMSIDQSTHSLFGASKVSADVTAQEYGKYFHLKVGIFRGGCLTGPQHSAVPLHGFLSYIIDCAVNQRPYTIIGYKGKQVRDQIHSKDVISAFHQSYLHPKYGEVYNIGGGKENSASILEVIQILKDDYGYDLNINYLNDPRVGDHICYFTNLSKLKNDFPEWSIQWSLPKIIKEIIERKSQ